MRTRLSEGLCRASVIAVLASLPGALAARAEPVPRPATVGSSPQPDLPTVKLYPPGVPGAKPEDPAEPPAVFHMPVATTPAAEPFRVTIEVRAAHQLAQITLHYRHLGEREFKSERFGRLSAEGIQFAAVIPGDQVIPGALEYYIGSRASGAGEREPERLHFAGPDAPHPVIVLGDEETRWRKELLAMHWGNRSRFQLQSEYVDFGRRSRFDEQGNEQSVTDFYWRLEGDYTYRILGWVYSIRLGAGLLRGSTYFNETRADGMVQPAQLPDPAKCDDPTVPQNQHYCRIGLTYGYAEMRFRFGRLVRADLRVSLGVGPEHFDGGAGGQLIIGHDPGTHFALGVDGISSLGARGWLRLAWNTVPRLPMSFTIEVTNLPDNHLVAGRIFLSAEFRFFRHLSINALLGYATRGWRVGGPAVGGGATIEF